MPGRCIRPKQGLISVDGEVVQQIPSSSDGPHEGNKQTNPNSNGTVFSADAPHTPNRALEFFPNATEMIQEGTFTETITVTNKNTGEVADQESVQWESKTVIRRNEKGNFEFIEDESYIRRVEE